MEIGFEGMTGRKGEEGDVFESEGGQRVNEDKESRPAERAKVEGESSGDGTKEEEGEEEANDKVERLRGLLAEDPKKMSEKDVEEVIKCLNVEEIISLALEPRQGKGSDDDDDADVDFDDDEEKRKEGEEGCVKPLDTVRLMVGCIECVMTRDIRLVYEKWPPKAFAAVLFSALDWSALRKSEGHSIAWPHASHKDPLKYLDYYDIIPKLCGVVPFKLFAHILDMKGVYSFANEAEQKETNWLITY